MNIRKLRIIFYLFSITIIILAVIVFILTRTVKPTPRTTAPVPQAKIPQLFSGRLNISLKVEDEALVFPSKITSIQIINLKLDDGLSKQVAKNLNFNFDPIILNDTLIGKRYFWKNDEAYFFANLDEGTFQYGLHQLSSGTKRELSEIEITNITENYIKNNFPSLSDNFKVSSISYLRLPLSSDEDFIKTSKENASLYRVVLTPKLSNIELVSLESNTSKYFVDILPDSNVYRIEISNISVTTPKQEFELISTEELKNSLDKSKLVKIEGDFIPVSELSDDLISSIEINQVKLAYLIDDSKTKTYYPVFLMSGPIKLKGSDKELAAFLYLSALKDTQP